MLISNSSAVGATERLCSQLGYCLICSGQLEHTWIRTECILVKAKAARQEGFLTPIDNGDKPCRSCWPVEVDQKTI